MASAIVVDPMGAVTLSPKFQKLLATGKLAGIKLAFNSSGFMAQGLLPGDGATWLPLADAMASTSKEAPADFSAEKAHAVSKYEKRLDEEAPAALRAATTPAMLEAAVAALEFRKRSAYNLSNKEFEMKYLRWENGTAVLRSAEQAESLRQERASARGGGNRGRGRGGRGRGSFRDPKGPAPQAQQGAQASK